VGSEPPRYSADHQCYLANGHVICQALVLSDET